MPDNGVWFNKLGNTLMLSVWVANYATDGVIPLQADTMQLYSIDASSLLIDHTFNVPAGYVDPNEYFADHLGTHSVTNGNMYLYPYPSGNTVMNFRPTSITFSTIPEPSTALLTGLGLLALVFRRRAGRLSVSRN